MRLCHSALAVTLIATASLHAQGRKYIRTEAMVPVRDGVKLHIVIQRPEGS